MRPPESGESSMAPSASGVTIASGSAVEKATTAPTVHNTTSEIRAIKMPHPTARPSEDHDPPRELCPAAWDTGRFV
jgi:hypothetical protein